MQNQVVTEVIQSQHSLCLSKFTDKFTDMMDHLPDKGMIIIIIMKNMLLIMMDGDMKRWTHVKLQYSFILYSLLWNLLANYDTGK